MIQGMDSTHELCGRFTYGLCSAEETIVYTRFCSCLQRVGEEDMSPKELALEGEIAISSLTTSPCARRDILSYLYCA